MNQSIAKNIKTLLFAMTDYTHNYKELPSAFFVLQKTGGSRGGEGRGQGGQGTGTGVSPWVSLEGCPPPVPLLSEWWGVGGKKTRESAHRSKGRGPRRRSSPRGSTSPSRRPAAGGGSCSCRRARPRLRETRRRPDLRPRSGGWCRDR